jgi:hypothetical protein
MAKDKTPKKAKKAKGPVVSETAISVAAHPRAAYAVRRAKGWGGLIGLLLVAWYSHQAGLMAVDVAIRALTGGIVGYVVAWVIALQVWRHLVIAEAHAAADRVAQRAAAAAESAG